MGLTDKITGRVKQAAGDLAGDEKLQKQGRREERPATRHPVSDRRTASTRCSRARATRDRMVPLGTPQVAAASS